MKKLTYRHRDIEYTLTNIEPDIWEWSFKIDGQIKHGAVHARLDVLAQRRVCMVIDRELKNVTRPNREPD